MLPELKTELNQLLGNLCDAGQPLEKLLLLADMQAYYVPVCKKSCEHIAELQHLLVLLSHADPEDFTAG